VKREYRVEVCSRLLACTVKNVTLQTYSGVSVVCSIPRL